MCSSPVFSAVPSSFPHMETTDDFYFWITRGLEWWPVVVINQSVPLLIQYVVVHMSFASFYIPFDLMYFLIISVINLGKDCYVLKQYNKIVHA